MTRRPCNHVMCSRRWIRWPPLWFERFVLGRYKKEPVRACVYDALSFVMCRVEQFQCLRSSKARCSHQHFSRCREKNAARVSAGLFECDKAFALIWKPGCFIYLFIRFCEERGFLRTSNECADFVRGAIVPNLASFDRILGSRKENGLMLELAKRKRANSHPSSSGTLVD